MNSEVMEAIDAIIAESNSDLEAMFGAMMYYLAYMLFRMVEVVVEFGTDTQEPH